MTDIKTIDGFSASEKSQISERKKFQETVSFMLRVNSY
jgi:hypothetical protein